MAIDQETKLNDALGKPLQMIPFKEKTQDWFKANVNWFISASRFNYGKTIDSNRNLGLLYGVYNNKFPMEWFSHITNPLNSDKKRNYQAKIRPVTIIRTNIDLLMGEYPKRPFVYNVENLGEAGYSELQDQLQKKMQKNLTDHFVNFTLQQMQAEGQQLTPQQVQKLQQDPPIPEQLKEEFMASYKDLRAIKGQHWLKRAIREKNIKRKLQKCFKDWLIAGEAYTYKGVRHGKLVYDRVSPLNIDYDRSVDSDFIEDGNWVVGRHLYSLADVVDHFYDKLKAQDASDLETSSIYYNQNVFYKYLQDSSFTEGEEHGKIPCYHVQWIGYKKQRKLSFFDPNTFQLVENWVDEDYVPDKLMEEKFVEERWVNERYEGWRIGSIEGDLFIDCKPSDLQRTEDGANTKPKLDYNGRRFSDTHAENISVLEIGLPFQLMFIIVNYILEKTIAKSKGKIVLMDKNVIPDEEDWDEETFFYYSEALGFALIDRNQDGVDKSWNQYTVLDMSLFDQIKQLIELQDSLKQQWDDVIGVTRQRKGQTYASDGQGVNERSVFQSTVITDHIFAGFEEFQERELQGIMDLGKIITSEGENSIVYDDMLGAQLLEILPEDFTNAELGVFVDASAEHMRKMQKAQEFAQAMLQNNSRVSTVLEVIDADNIAELKMKVKRIEEIEAQLAQQNVAAEQDHEKELEGMKEKYLTLQKMLDRQNMEAEYDRKDQELLWELGQEASLAASAPSEEGNSNEPNIADLQKLQNDRQKMQMDSQHKNADRQLKQHDQSLKAVDTHLKTVDQQRKNAETAHKIRMDVENLKLEHQKLYDAEKQRKEEMAMKNKELAVKRIADRKKPASK
jgi:hypothetical protein